MKFLLDLNIPALPQPIQYPHKILLIGSCFTEHISERLSQHKFNLLSNPNGILFNPLSVANSLNSYLDEKIYQKEDLFYLNELWNSWDHHTRFSDTNQDTALATINTAQMAAAEMIKKADWIVITLGSAFQYYLKENDRPVANNHRAPSQWFEKKLLSTDGIVESLASTLNLLKSKNECVKVLFTISPVRHIRDGVVDNNRSKARLIEAVHQLCDQFSFAHYFPAYEIVIDVLRDYRYYDIDLVHPNFAATAYVWECFVRSCIETETADMMNDIAELTIASKHRPRFAETNAHKTFLAKYASKAKSLAMEFPFLDLSDMITYFEQPTKEQ